MNPLIQEFAKTVTVYDVSMPVLTGMPVWRNKPQKQPEFETTSDYVRGTTFETRFHIDAHTGTHIDAPLHMVENGATMEAYPLNQLVRMCRVVDVSQAEDAIHAEDLERVHPKAGEFLLLKTRNSAVAGWDDGFVYVAEDAARLFVDIGVAGVGIDALGIERSQPGHPTHKSILGAGIVILEGLRLADVPEGEYFMTAAPIRLEGVEASLARVLLFG
jgi:arylformamidase